MKIRSLNNKIIWIAALAIVSVFCVYAVGVQAAFNKQINYQGKLTNASNIAVADSTYNIRFKLYTAQNGGSPIWTETWCYSPDSGSTCDGTGTNNRIQVTNGLFSTLLGSTTAFTGVDFNQTLYLGVEVGGTTNTPSWDGEMSPRKKLGAVPAAFVADTLQGFGASEFVRSDASNSTTTATTFLSIVQLGAGKIAEFFGTASQTVLSLLSNGNVGVGTTTPGWRFSVAGIGAFDDNVRASYFIATSTSRASTFPYASTTALTVSGTATTSNLIVSNALTAGSFTLGALNGPLQAINGAVSATSTLSIAYGGTGVSTAPSYGSILVGNTTGGYTLTATTSLGLAVNGAGTQGQLPFYNAAGTALTATSSLFLSQAGSFGIGTTTLAAKLSIMGIGNTSATNSFSVKNSAGDSLMSIRDDGFIEGYNTAGQLAYRLSSIPGSPGGFSTRGGKFTIGVIDAGFSAGIQFGANSSSGRTFIDGWEDVVGSGYDLILAASDRSDSNIGIGVSSTGGASGKLHVRGDAGVITSIFQGESGQTADLTQWRDINNNVLSAVNKDGWLGIGTTSPYARLSVVGQAVAAYFTATTTTASTFPYASTTALTVSGANGLTLNTSLNGPLQAVGGLVSSTSTLSINYGGTGLSTKPSYGQVLLGNALGGYTLTATSSLGITASQWIANGSSIYYGGGNVGIGSTTPNRALAIQGSQYISNNLGIGSFNTTKTLALGTAASTSVIIRPNADGATSGLFNNSGNHTNNYTYVDDSSSDGDTTFVGADTSGLTDRYNMTDPGISGTISNARLCAIARDTGLGTDLILSVYVNGTSYTGTTFSTIPTSYTEYCYDWPVNPNTNLPWTSSDIDSVQAGVSLLIGASLPGDTLVETPDGLKRIDSLHIGDHVYSYDGTHKVLDTVTNFLPHNSEHKELTHYIFNGNLDTTGNHRIYTVNRGYIRADEVVEGDTLLGSNLEHVAVDTISTYVSSEPVYDITVEKNNNFFADGYLVHNVNDTGRITMVYMTISYTPPTSGDYFTVDTSGNTYISGRTSIGTTTAYSKLSVWGVGTGTGQIFELTNNSSSTVARILDNGSGFFTGTIGIGTTTATNKLTVAGDVTPAGDYDTNGQLAIRGATNPLKVLMLGVDTNATTNFAYIQSSLDNTATRALSLNPIGGNVGIGTTTPWRTLSVTGSSDLGNNALAGFFTATSTTASVFPYASTTALTVSGTNGLTLNTSLNGPLQAVGGLVSSTSTLSINYGGTGLSTKPAYGNILVGNATGGYTLTATTSLGITSSQWTTSGSNIYYNTGNVSVGTSTPFAKFGINANFGDTNLQLFTVASTSASASSTLFTILNNGNIGIGTSTPTQKLAISNGGLQFNYLAGNTTPVTLAVVASAGNLGVGLYHYRIAWLTPSGVTDAPAAGDNSVTTTGGSQQVLVTRPTMPVGATGWRIYRNLVGGSLFSYFKVADVTDTTTTSYQDNIADTSLQGARLAFDAATAGIVTGRNTSAGTHFLDSNSITVDNQGGLNFSSIGAGISFNSSGKGDGYMRYKDYWTSTQAFGGSVSDANSSASEWCGQGFDASGVWIAGCDGSGSYTAHEVRFQSSAVGAPLYFAIKRGQTAPKGWFDFNESGTSIAGLVFARFQHDTWTAASGVNTLLALSNPAIAMSGSAGYRILDINTTQTSNGTGVSELLTVRDGTGYKFLVTNSGNVGIGTSTPWGKFSIAPLSSNTDPIMTISTSTASATSTAFIIDANGKVGIGTTTPWRTLGINGRVSISNLTSSAVGNALCLTAGNEVTTAGAAACSGVSSQRFKHDITSSDLGLSTIMAMRPVTFRYNQGYGDSGLAPQFGFIAEETYNVDPRLTIVDDSGQPTTVRYDFIAPILTKAVQEQQARLNSIASSTQALLDWKLSMGTSTLARPIYNDPPSDSEPNPGGPDSATAAALSALNQGLSNVTVRVDALSSTTASLLSRISSIATSTDAASSTAHILSSDGGFIDAVATSTADKLATSTTFIARVANLVREFIASTGEWIVSKITATSIFTNRLETDTLSVKQGIEMTDQATGSIYCVIIKNGDLDKHPGTCLPALVASSTPIQQQAPIVSSPDPLTPPTGFVVPPSASSTPPAATSTPPTTVTPDPSTPPPTTPPSTPPDTTILPPDTNPNPPSQPSSDPAPAPTPAPAPAADPAPAP